MAKNLETKTKLQSPKTNKTKDKLKGTPFSNAEELKKAQHEILEETWRKLEKARIKRELTKRDEYNFFIETFRKGMVCKYGEQDDSLVKVSLESDNSVKVSINENMKSKENSEYLLGVLIESTSSSFLSNYLKAMDIVDTEQEIQSQATKIKNSLHKQRRVKPRLLE